MINCPFCQTPFIHFVGTKASRSYARVWGCGTCQNNDDLTSLISTKAIVPNIEVHKNEVIYYYLPHIVEDKFYLFNGNRYNKTGPFTTIFTLPPDEPKSVVYKGPYFQPTFPNPMSQLIKFFNKIDKLKCFL
jgi:hypothetical protein